MISCVIAGVSVMSNRMSDGMAGACMTSDGMHMCTMSGGCAMSAGVIGMCVMSAGVTSVCVCVMSCALPGVGCDS